MKKKQMRMIKMTKRKIEMKIYLIPDTNENELYDWLHQWLSYDKRIDGFNIDSFEWVEETEDDENE